MSASPAAGLVSVERRVRQYVRSLELLRHGEPTLLMLSGGADSMALLKLVQTCDTSLDLSLKLAALHVDYGLRGADSDRDRHIVEEACHRHKLELHVVRAPAGLRGASFQERARELRYAAARALAVEWGYTRIVTAHNRDDQAETVLYRLLKYPSPAALAGMAPLEGDLARPLLCLGADEVRAYCRTAGIVYGDDVTNAQPVYVRNRLRLRVLRELRDMNPRVVEGLADASAVAREERVLLDALAEEAWARVSVGSVSGSELECLPLFSLDVVTLAAEPPALRAACLRRLVRSALGEHVLVTRRLTEALGGLVEGLPGRRIALPGGWEAARMGRLLTVARRASAHTCEPAGASVRGGAVVSLSFCERGYPLELLAGDYFARATDEAWIGLPVQPVDVVLRHPRRGERFAPLGAGGSVTVLQFLADHGVPSAARARALLVEVDGAVAWVAGRVAQSFRVAESTNFTLHVRGEGQ